MSRCATCGVEYEMGAAARCSVRRSCKALNAVIKCICGLEIAEPPTGVLNAAGELLHFKGYTLLKWVGPLEPSEDDPLCLQRWVAHWAYVGIFNVPEVRWTDDPAKAHCFTEEDARRARLSFSVTSHVELIPTESKCDEP